MIKVSVIIVAYKNGTVLQNSLNYIQKYNDLGDELEIIIIDNSPKNETVEQQIIESSVNNYKYIRSSNCGFGASNNKGAKIAKGEVLAFINPDVYLVEYIFKDVYKKFELNKNIMMLGCQLLDANKQKTFSFFYDFEDSIIKRIKTKIRNYLNLYDMNEMFTSGCNMFIRKEAFEKAGCFDENIFMYNEEADIKRRIIKEYPDCDIVFDKDHSIIHLGGSRAFSEARFKLLKDSIVFFGQKYNLDVKKKLRYEYKIAKTKRTIYSFLNNNKCIEIEEEIKCFEKYYMNYIK